MQYDTHVGNIPNDWKAVTVREVTDVNAQSIKKGYPYAEIEYIDISSVNEGRIDTPVRIPRKEAPSRAKRIVRNNDILISTVRPNLKHYAFVKNTSPNTIASTGFAVVSAKDILPRFLYYCLTGKKYTEYLVSIAESQTSAYPAFNPDTIEDSIIPKPSDPEQRGIAHILGSLDDKIELNREMNKTLEEMTQPIFKSWFVNFNPVRAKIEGRKPFGMDDETAAFFPDKMKWNDELETVIPEGWVIVTLSDVATVIDCLHSKKPNRQITGKLLLQVYNIGDKGNILLDESYYITDDDYQKWISRMEVRSKDLIISKTGRVGAIARIPSGIKAAMGRNLVGLRAKNNINSEYLRDLLFSTWMKKEIGRLTSDGTILRSLHVKSIEQLRVILPPKEILNRYAEIVLPIHLMIENNDAEIITLKDIRDTLLPKLMSGKIRVNPENVKGVA